MAYSVGWYIDKRVTYQRLYGHVTLEDVRDINAESIDISRNGIPLVHSVIDITGVQKFPTNLAAIREIMSIQTDGDAVGWVLIVGADNPVIRFIASVITQLVMEKIHFRLMDSMDAALEFLQEHDATLKGLEPVRNRFSA